MRYSLSFFFLLVFNYAYCQNGILKGKVYNSINNEAIPFATIGLQGTTIATTSDADGNFEIKQLTPGLYNIIISCVGFQKKTIYEIELTNARPTILNIALDEETTQLQEAEVVASPFNKTEESPVSLRTIGTSEIERNPGGNRDISKVIQSLPGVASTASFRNDIIIRGGAPNENRFYLDGVEVPNINHFATQGSSGGPVGMINVNFIREVDFYSGAFPANRGNTLSSVFEFKQKDGNNEKRIFTGTIGASDIGLTMEGPLGKKTTFILSARRSYLQFLFQALKLPFLPTYNDMQFKVKTRLNDKNEITLIGLGALDDFELNKSANETEQQKYILGNIPVNNQWNYTVGANYKHYRDKSYWTVVISQNQLNNRAYKYLNNDERIDTNKILDYVSRELENKVRIENTWRDKGYKINGGVGYENVLYTNNTYNKIALPGGIKTINFNSKLSFNKYAAFIQASKTMLANRLVVSAGVRTDIADYSAKMSNPIDQLSPRISLSYALNTSWSLNANAGRYYQLPAYTVLGYRNGLGELVNKNNGVEYIGVNHLVAGVEYNTGSNAKITVEGFYKEYNNYPFLLNDSISLANLGGDFGVVGNAPVNSSSTGRSYGVEFLAQQKLYKGFYGIIAYTFVRSEFAGRNGTYAPSAWDNVHLVTLTAGKKFKRNWELGARWRFLGGTPYTPFNITLSSLKSVWDITGRGLPDYSRLNTLRSGAFHQLDLRIDKKWFLNKWSLNIYFDVQNAYNFEAKTGKLLLLDLDTNGNPQTDPQNPAAYKTKQIDNTSGNVLPTIGLIVEF